MLSKETVQKIAEFLKIKTTDLQSAISDEKEMPINIDEKLSTFTEDEVTQVKNNEYKKGKAAGVEMDIKEAKEKLGLDFSGKTLDGLIEAVSRKTLADAKIEPDTKYTELNEKFTTLQKTVGEYETKLSDKDNEVTGIKVHAEILKHIPANATLSGDEIIGLMRMKGHEFKMVDGKVVTFKDGKELQDKLSNAMNAADVIGSFVKERKFAPEPAAGGRGGGDDKGKIAFTSISQIKEKFKSEGKSLLGSEFSQAVAEAAKEPEFDMKG